MQLKQIRTQADGSPTFFESLMGSEDPFLTRVRIGKSAKDSIIRIIFKKKVSRPNLHLYAPTPPCSQMERRSDHMFAMGSCNVLARLIDAHAFCH